MSKFSERFNAMPDDARSIACDLALEVQVRDLQSELLRLKRRYETSRKEITEKIIYCENELIKRLSILDNQEK